MRQYSFAVLGMLIQVCGSIAFAAGMPTGDSTLFFEERPTLIPVGRSVMGMKTDFARSSEWIDSDGARRTLGENFSEKIATKDGLIERTYRVQASFNQFTPYWGYGLNSVWSLYAAIPIRQMHSQSRVDYQSEIQNLTQNKAASLFAERDDSPFRAPTRDRNDLLVGQVFFLSQVQIIDRHEGQLAFIQKVRVPTGERDDLAYFVSGSPEASGYGLELGLLADYDGPYQTQLYSRVKGLLNFSDTIYAREYGSSDFFKVQRDPGESIEGATGVEREVFENIHLGTDYVYVQTFADTVPENIDAFSENSRVHLIRGLLAYRGPQFLRQRRLDDQSYSGRLIYSQVLAGQNVPEYQALGLEFSLAY